MLLKYMLRSSAEPLRSAVFIYVFGFIAAFAEAGVTNLQVMPASDDPPATIRQLRELVD